MVDANCEWRVDMRSRFEEADAVLSSVEMPLSSIQISGDMACHDCAVVRFGAAVRGSSSGTSPCCV